MNKSPQFALKFAKVGNSMDFTAKEAKELRDIEKECKSLPVDGDYGSMQSSRFKSKKPRNFAQPYGGFQPQGSPYGQPVQQPWQNQPGMQQPNQFRGNPMQRPHGPGAAQAEIKRNGRWPAWCNRCNDCDLQGHWSGSNVCPMSQANSAAGPSAGWNAAY